MTATVYCVSTGCHLEQQRGHLGVLSVVEEVGVGGRQDESGLAARECIVLVRRRHLAHR